MNRFTLAAAGLVLGALPALAQSSNPPPATPAPNASAASSVVNMTELKPGMWRASKLSGVNVYNNNNEKIGDISDVIIDQSGKAQAVVIGVGGFLGMGQHDVAVSFEQLKWSDEPVRSASSSGNNASSTSSTASNSTARTSNDVTGTTRSNANDRGYPDHAVLNMTKDQLKAAPEFKWSSNSSSK